MIKVASAAPMNSQPVANGFPAPPPSVPAGDAASAMVYTNPAVGAELLEVNEPEKPLNGGEAKLLMERMTLLPYWRLNMSAVKFARLLRVFKHILRSIQVSLKRFLCM